LGFWGKWGQEAEVIWKARLSFFVPCGVSAQESRSKRWVPNGWRSPDKVEDSCQNCLWILWNVMQLHQGGTLQLYQSRISIPPVLFRALSLLS